MKDKFEKIDELKTRIEAFIEIRDEILTPETDQDLIEQLDSIIAKLKVRLVRKINFLITRNK